MNFKKRIFFRFYPTEKLNFEYIKIDTTCNKIYIRHLQELSKKVLKKDPTYWEFDTNGVFFNATQQSVYDEVTKDLLDNIVGGYTGVIISFGQTGSGKTFTNGGLHFSEEEFGIAPRIAKDLLDLKKNQPSNMKTCIQISYLELYNTYAVDLLKELPNTLDFYKCRDAKKIKIRDEFEALKCLFLGEGRKNFVENNSQYLSNVCSSVITFHITSKNMDLTNPTKINSRLHVIDLVGNDICTNISQLNKNLKQIGTANVTKSQLEQFILRLTNNLPESIRLQQRMNVLLYYLDGDFSCENILRFVGHIKARSEDILITLSMLRFGHVIQGLKPKTKQINFEMNEEVELEFLKKKLESYEKEKHLNSVLLNVDLVSGLNPPRIDHLNSLVQSYLQDHINEITVMNVADTQLVLKNMKEIYTNSKNEINRLQAENQVLLAHQSEVSLKHRTSKSSSQSSGSKISRKSSKVRSKDGIAKDRKASASTMSEKIVSSEDQAVSVDMSMMSKKGSKKRSITTSSMKTSAKKKMSSTSINKQDSKSSIKSSEFRQLIPDTIPEKKEIWKNFSTNHMYKDRLDEYKNNEKEIRNSFVTYVNDIKKLHACKEAVIKYRNDLIKAQTFRKFQTEKDEYDDTGLLIISQAEKYCKDLLDEAQILQTEQQENVLRSQEELKVHLGNRQDITRKIEEEFENFVKEHYKIPPCPSQEIVDDLNEITFNVNLEHPKETLENVEETVTVPQISVKIQLIKKLQKLMSLEIEKRKRLIEQQKHKWKIK